MITVLNREELITNIVQLTKVKADLLNRDMDPRLKARDVKALDEAITGFGRQLAALPDDSNTED